MPHAVTLAVCFRDWYGVRRALHTYTDNVVTPAEAIAAIDQLKPTVVLFGCYLPEWEPILRHARARGCVCVLTWYASYILNEFDSINRKWLAAALAAYRAGLFTHIAVPHAGLAAAWTERGYPTADMPLAIRDVFTVQPKREGIHIGIFGSGQPWKNMECQLVAASLIPNATIHVHRPPAEPSALQSLNIHCVAHPYMHSDAEYYALLGSMSINLCVSLSETYSYLTAESLLMGVPVLTSHITPILRTLPDTHPLAVCRTPWFDDPRAIADGILRVLEQRETIARLAPAYMRTYNARTRMRADHLLEYWYAAATRPDRVRS